MARIFGTVNPLPNLAPSWNIAPTLDAAVVRRHLETGARHLDLLTWGLQPYWTKEPSTARRPINARSDHDRDALVHHPDNHAERGDGEAA